MRSLYIDGRRRAMVLRDGPALRIVSEGRADGIYPLRRLARVVVCGAVEWHSDALLACLDEGIPITFLTQQGEPRAYCLAAHPRRQHLHDRLEDLLARTDWHSLYENWRRAAERRAILALLRRLRLRAPDLRPDRIAMHLLATLTTAPARPLARHILSYLRGLLAARLTARLHEAGLGAQILVGRRPAWNLPGDLTGILAWRHYLWLRETPDLLQTGVAPPEQAALRRRLTEIFENRSEETEKAIRQLLDQFTFWLGGLQ